MSRRDQYRAAHREARLNRRHGLWLRNPIRLADGYPGLWVAASGEVQGYALVDGVATWSEDLLP